MNECRRCGKESASLTKGECKKCLKKRGLKLCSACGELKLSFLDFYEKKSVCKECCSATPHLTREERYRNGHLKRTYGITLEEYDDMLRNQGGGCAICQRPPGKRKLAVDHDHTTGRVRGLLCSSCNVMLGMAQDSRHVLNTALAYLEKNDSDRTVVYEPTVPVEPSVEVRRLEHHVEHLREQLATREAELIEARDVAAEIPDPQEVICFLRAAKILTIEKYKIKNPETITIGPLVEIDKLVRQIRLQMEKAAPEGAASSNSTAVA